jgi:nucleoside-diphosphate-sugar epimerase
VKALVTGATGFVGSHVVDVLLARGDDVVVLARSVERAAPLVRLGARVALGTLEDAAALASAVAGVDVVYHLAGLTAAVSEAEYQRVNAEGTRRLVQAAQAVSPTPHIVYVSTQAVLGPSTPGQALDEEAPCRPLTAYGRSKLAGEAAVREAEGLPWTIVRPAAVYGPRDREFLAMFRLVRTGIAPVFGAGTQQLSLVYAPDLAEAIARAGAAPGAAGRTYHVAHDEVVTTRELALTVGRAVGRTPLVVPVPGVVATPIVSLIGWIAAARGRLSTLNADKMAEFLAPAWVVSSARAARDLRWQASHGIAEGARLTAAWYREKGWLT